MPPLFPKPLPISRPQKLLIYSLFTLQKSLKNYPKHFKCLKVETRDSGVVYHQILPKSLLTRLQRRSKSLPILDFEKHEQFFDLKIPQALKLIKSFNHLNSLSLFGNIWTHFSNKSYPKWFTQSKKLTHVVFGTYSASGISPEINFFHFRKIQIRYKKILKRSKFLSLDLKSHESIPQSKHYPPMLHKLSISLDSVPTSPQINLSYLHHLSILHLKVPLLFQKLLKIISSLSNPQRITRFTAYVSDEGDLTASSAQKISETLALFQSLCSLHLQIHSFQWISILYKSLKNTSSLRELTLHLPIHDYIQLINLALLVQTSKNLSLLAIVNSKRISGPAIQGHQILFQQISRLTQLKSLEINLCGESKSLQEFELFHGCLAEFVSCLEKLHELQEIKFTQSESYTPTEFDSLADVLKKKGSKVQKLKLKFFIGDKKIDHLKKLNKAFQTMGNLEEISLENLSTAKESLVQFGEIISELKRIRMVELDGKNPGLEKEDLFRTLKKILMKYGLEELKWFSEVQIYNLLYFPESMDVIDVKEVIFNNPRLHRICFDIRGETSRELGFKNMTGFLP